MRKNIINSVYGILYLLSTLLLLSQYLPISWTLSWQLLGTFPLPKFHEQ